MSLVQSIQYELSNSVRHSSTSTREDASQQSRPPSIAVQNAPIEAIAIEAGSPPPQRRVFDVAPLNVMGKTRKTAITVLIITSNLVQVKSYQAIIYMRTLILVLDDVEFYYHWGWSCAQ